MTDSIDRSSELKRVLGSLHCDFEAENPNEYSYSQKCKWCGEIRTNQCHTLFGEIEALYTSPGYRDWETDRKSTRLNSSHSGESRMPSSA